LTQPEILSEVVGVTAKAVVDNADRLGLTWSLRLATVTGKNGEFVTARYDGDSAGIDMVSMIGPVAASSRVYVLKVPPSGNFIVGTTQPVTVAVCLGANASDDGTLATSSGSEVAVPSASWDTEPVYSLQDNRIFKVTITGARLYTAIGVSQIKVRKGAATTSGTELCRAEIEDEVAGIGAGVNLDHVGWFANTSGDAVNTALSLTIIRATGSGNHSLFGDGVRPMIMTVEDCGPAVGGVLDGVTAIVPSV
jgi:hypothetical protein